MNDIWSISQIFKLIKLFLHLINFILLNSFSLNCSYTCPGQLSSSSHCIFTLDFLKQRIYFVLGDAGSINVLKSCVHFTGLHLHVFKNFFKFWNVLPYSMWIHLLHCFCQNWNCTLHCLTHLICSCCTFNFRCQCWHFHSESSHMNCFFPLSNNSFSIDFGFFNFVFWHCI